MATYRRGPTFHLVPVALPSQALSYRIFLLRHAFQSWQMPPNGLGASLNVEVGEVYIVVSDPETDAHQLAFQPLKEWPQTLNGKLEAILLQRHERL